MNFDNKYLNYWKNRVEKSTDGTRIPSPNDFKPFINTLKLSSKSKILDLGCGFGRFFPILSKISKDVHGFDISQDMLDDAVKNYKYNSLTKGDSKNLKFSDNYFDFVFCVGLFDVIDQENTLKEINRVLKNGGKVLFTGKNINYSFNDKLALRAEKNCFLKNFNLYFTDLKLLIEHLNKYGFEINHKSIFEKRGDFAKKNQTLIEDYFYEYLVIFTKKESIENQIPFNFSKNYSDTIKKLFKLSNHNSFKEFCKF